MSKFIKENWFVSLLVVVFTVITVYYIVDSNKDKLKGKKVDGKDIVYEIADDNISADDFYDELYKKSGPSVITYLFTQDVADQAVETTDEMKEFAKQQATAIIGNFASQYPNDYKEHLNREMKQMGYSGMDDLDKYLIIQQKIQKLTADYAKDHFDELKIRNISYILVKAEHPNTALSAPTANEQKRIDAINEKFKKGDSFEDIAKEFSEDPSSAPTGGVLGTIDKNTANLDQVFLKTALSLNENETSDWVHSEQFGWFKIHCNAATPETLLDVVTKQTNPHLDETPAPTASADAKEEKKNEIKVDPYQSLISTYDTTLVNKAIFAKAEELGMDFHGNTELENQIRTALGIEPKEENAEEEKEPAETSAPTESPETK